MKADTFPPEDDAPYGVPLRIPPWVPEPVAQAAHDAYTILGQYGDRDRAFTCLTRLVSDERMRRVWHELARRQRGGTFMYPAAMAPVWQPISEEAKVWPPSSEPDKCNDVAMAELLRVSLLGAIQPGTTLTRQQAEDDRRRYLAMARQLRTENASQLQMWLGPPLKRRDIDRHRVLASAARTYEEAAARIANKLQGKSPKFPIIRKRDHGDSADQYLALRITGYCRGYFGSPLYGVTAIVMSVILDREITPRAVRQWCAHPADKPPKTTC
jgi:hypothetical protein